ncbi:MAG: thioesterase family protein, partial [Actinobacteria bacterium]|nr:thioesterase family protein [Actinomycetota bacterium]
MVEDVDPVEGPAQVPVRGVKHAHRGRLAARPDTGATLDDVPAYRDITTVIDGAWQVPPGWAQGRGAWGGLGVGMAVRAAEQADRLLEHEGDEPARVVREVSVDMLAPVPVGPSLVREAPLRIGSGTSAWRVVVGAEPDVLVSASVVLGRERSGDQPTMVDARL